MAGAHAHRSADAVRPDAGGRVGPPAEAGCRHPELGRAVQRRAAEVAAEVVARWSQRSSVSGAPYDEVARVITQTSSLGTKITGRFIASGEGVSPAEAEELAASSRLSALWERSPIDLTRNYLIWRDVLLNILTEETERLGLGGDVLAAAQGVIRRSCDGSLIQMVKQFDVERQVMQARLDAEREKLAYLALHDSLTGLANRTLLMDRLEHIVASSQRRQEQAAVLFLDLDGFKAVNDSLGHKAGDRLLVHVAEVLRTLVRPADTVARFGGDEFVVLCENLVGGEPELDALQARVRAGLAASFAPGDKSAVSVSIGAALAAAGTDPESVLVLADAAMYAAKQRERNCNLHRG